MARICVIAYTDYAADPRVRRAAEALVQRGDEVRVICPLTRLTDGRAERSGVILHPTRAVAYAPSTNPLTYVRRYLTFLIAAAFHALRLHLKHRFDVVHVHTMPDFLIFSAIGPKLLGAKLLLDVHDLTPELYASKFDLAESHWIIKGLQAVERASVRLADAAVAVHEPHLNALLAHGNPRDKFTIVMNLPDPAIFRHRNGKGATDDFTLIYHGTVGARHGLDVAVRAVDLARRQVPEIKLRIIGDGDDFDRVAALVDTLGVAASIQLEQGFQRIEDVVPAIECATVGVVPIVDDPFTRYMLPLKLLEYVAVGIPVISSSTPTIRAYFSDDMLAFTVAGDAESLAARMVELYRDPATRERLALEAAKFTEAHHWAKEKQGYYQLIDRLVAS